MVKHWKRTHQRGTNSPELDDMISDGGSDSAPPTPDSHPAMPWQAHHGQLMGNPGHQIQRAASFADFGQHMNGYGLQQPYNHRHSLSSNGQPEYHGAASLGQPPLHHGHPQQQQHPGVQILQRTGSMPHHHNYFVPDQNNPGVATMNTTQHPAAQHPHYQPHVPRQGVERLPLEIPAYPNAQDLANSMPNNSPGSFSAASGRSPSAQDGFYTHVPPGQTAAYTLSPVTQQTSQMMTFPQGAVTAAQVMAQQQQPVQQQQQAQQQQPQNPQAATPQSAVVEPQYQQPQAVPQPPQQWYDSAQYQSPVEVTTIGSLPPFGSGGLYDPWGQKLEFEDPSMQLPSARVESM